MSNNLFRGNHGDFRRHQGQGAAYRLTEETLYAEALREIESGQRRDGIWAKAMAESNMDQGKPGAKYIKMRVQSLKDEITVFIAEMKRVERIKAPEPALLGNGTCENCGRTTITRNPHGAPFCGTCRRGYGVVPD